jgi:hypothetical protein
MVHCFDAKKSRTEVVLTGNKTECVSFILLKIFIFNFLIFLLSSYVASLLVNSVFTLNSQFSLCCELKFNPLLSITAEHPT